MRILCWNMGGGFGGSTARELRCWDYLDGQEWDVALLQETRKPPARYQQVWRPKYATRGASSSRWGCAVVARALKLEPFAPGSCFPWLAERTGSTAIARTAGEPCWFASVHLHASEIAADVVGRHSLDGIEIPTRDGSVWEQNVIPHDLHSLFGTGTFVWGGDFNSEPRMDAWLRNSRGGNHRNFAIYREYGSLDTRARFFDDFQQTFFKNGRKPYQLDHVFADARTEARIVDWRVDHAAATCVAPYSDHAPVILTLG